VIDLSVVIPVYREGEAARAVIEAVAGRLLAVRHEILVVHDEPSDPTVPVVRDVARRYPSVRPVSVLAGGSQRFGPVFRGWFANQSAIVFAAIAAPSAVGC